MASITRRSLLSSIGFVAVGATLSACSKKVEYGTDSTSSAASSGTEEKTGVDNRSIEIVDSGWTVAGDSAVYAVTLHNASTEAECHFPSFTVTGKDAEGKILFSDEQTLNFMRPGDTYTLADSIHKQLTPATIEFATKNNEKKWTENKNTQHDAPYTFANLNEVPGTVNTSFTGEMTINKAWSDVSTVRVSAVLRDASGKMIGGYSTYVTSIGPEGSTMPVEVTNLGQAIPDHASFELFGIPWM